MRLPGADDAAVAELRRLQPRGGRQPPQGLRARRSARSWPASGRSSSPAASRPGLRRASSAPSCSTSSSRSPTTPSTSRHSYGYGLVAYQTAWLKANYPVEYLAALLTSRQGRQGQDRRLPRRVPGAGHRGAGPRHQRVGVGLHGASGGRSTTPAIRPTAAVIPFGLSAVRNVGEGLVAQIARRAREGGPVHRLLRLLPPGRPVVLNKRTVESLIKAGAFDSLGHPRKGCCLVFEQIIDRTLARRRERDAGGHEPLRRPRRAARAASFDDARVPIPDVEFDKHQRLAFEKEMLGLYVSDHPLMGLEAALRRPTECTIAELLEARGRGDPTLVGGVVTNLLRKYTRKGDLMATFVLEDLQAAIDVWVFPRTMPDVGSLLADDAVVVRQGSPRPARRRGQAGLHGHPAPRARCVDGVAARGRPPPGHPHRHGRRPAEGAPARATRAPSPVYLHIGAKTPRPGRPVQRRHHATACAPSCGCCSAPTASSVA